MNKQISFTGRHPLQEVVAELKAERAAAIARAEAAEATQVETLENILQALGVDPNGIDEIYLEQTATGCITALIARVTELEQDCSNAY